MLNHFLTGKERRMILNSIRIDGMFEFNSKNPDFLMVARRQKEPTTGDKFKVCYKCRQYCIATNLRHHVRKCTNNALGGERAVLQLSRQVERRIHNRASDMLVDRSSKLIDDDVARIVKFDWLLIAFGNKIAPRYKEHFHHRIVRAKLRLAGRILLQIKTICPEVSDFASIYEPKRFDQLVDAIRMVGGYEPANGTYRAPSTASDAVTLMRDISKSLVVEHIRQDNTEALRITENFMKLMNSEISDAISKPVIEAKATMRGEREEMVPLTADVKLFAKHIDTQRQLYFSELMKEFSYPVWRKLTELTMASVIVFNKRRVGEIQNMKKKDFDRRTSLKDTSADLYENLSDNDKKIADRFKHVEIRGKRRRRVPVLVKPHVEQCLNLILKHRKDAGILEGNNCLFALRSRIENEIKVVDAGNYLFLFIYLVSAELVKIVNSLTFSSLL